MAEPISLDEARRGRTPEDPAVTDHADCPLTALGHAEGQFHFINLAGEVRRMAGSNLTRRGYLLELFIGHTDWLEEHFPERKAIRETVAGETVLNVIESGFNASKAGGWLMQACGDAGIFGAHVLIRQTGIWPGPDGVPAAHCGDTVWINGAHHRAGRRLDGTVWAIGAPRPHPAKPAAAETGRQIEADMTSLWNFRQYGGAVICLGLVGAAYFGAAAPWRPNGFICGGAGSGKSMLLNTMRAMSPLHHYTNDTSAAGVLGALNGHAMPIFIDEASDRVDQSGAQRLMDIVLSASGGEGTQGHRGLGEGGYRTVSVAGSFIYGSVAPPELQPQHLARITMVELKQPDAGIGRRAPMEAMIDRLKTLGPSLWARALAGWDRWCRAMEIYRAALAAAGCAAREQDQMSAILAGHWILTEDAVPDERQARIGVAAIQPFIRVAEDVADDDSPRRAIQHMLGVQIQYDGTSRKEQIGLLLETGFEPHHATGDNADIANAQKTLSRFGIRVIRATDLRDSQDRPVPRMAEGDGVWIMPQVARAHFVNTRFEGDRWKTELMRLASARQSRSTVRVGGVTGKAFWVSRHDITPAEPITFAALMRALDRPAVDIINLMGRHGDRFPVAFKGKTVETDYMFDQARVVAFIARTERSPNLDL